MSKVRPDPIAVAVDNWRQAGWGSAAAGMALVTSVMRVQQLLVTQIDERLRPYGLSFARFEILRLLAFSRHAALPMGTVGRRLQVHPASVTSAVDRLERDELVLRTRSVNDGRRVMVALTPVGRSLVERATVDLNSYFESIGMSDEQIEGVVEALRDLRHSAGDIDAGESVL
jgi:DNA-binding MarR family transcriptional regulator